MTLETLTPQDRQALRAAFDSACQHPPGAARDAALSAARSARPLSSAALEELQSLLAHLDASTSLMAQPAVAQVAASSAEEAVTAHSGNATTPAICTPGQRLGAWEIVQRIGTGGMGEVYEARRADGSFEGRAAVKLLKRGMDSAAVLQRFALERQALARLNHPHIARLLDAGANAEGLPYFVMEHVQGEPVHDAALKRPLTQRLDLFLQLAGAVAHAHRNLLLHRDLKPGNVLVDEQGQVKLLDFGIAKALDPLEGAASDATVGGQRPFTPQYASPEQVRGDPVSTATDVYALGVLLYLMLTGARPTGRRADTAAAAARSVLQEPPTRPSRLSADEARCPNWSATQRQLEGDLDNILLKALEKSPEQRYASVDAFAADVRAHLKGRPVSARAAQPLYLLTKFAQRNRAAVWTGGIAALGLATALVATLMQGRAAAAAGVVAMAAALVVALVQARRAASARDAATAAGDEARAQLERVKRITNDLVFRYGDTVTHMPGGARAQEAMLLETVALLEPAVQASNDADLAATMASALGRIAEIQGNNAVAARERSAEAGATATRALALADRAWPQRLGDWRFASWYLRTCIVQSQLLRGRGAINEARAVMEQATVRAAAALALQPEGEGHLYMGTGLANSHLELAQVLFHPVIPSFRQSDEALAHYHQAEQTLRALMARTEDLAALDRKAPPGSFSNQNYLAHQVGTIIGSRALIELRHDRVPQALAEVEAAMVLRRLNVEREPRHVWWRQGLMGEAATWAQCLLQLGRHEEGLEAATLAWDTMRALAQDEGPQSKWARPPTQSLVALPYGWALLAAGRPAEAVNVLEPALAHWASETSDEAAAKAAQAKKHLHAAQEALGASRPGP